MVYNETLDAYVEHLCLMVSKLKEHQLYVKKENFKFCHLEMLFLGHLIG